MNSGRSGPRSWAVVGTLARSTDVSGDHGTGSNTLASPSWRQPSTSAAQDRGPDLPLFMEDTAWPHPGRREAYLERAATLYVPTLERATAAGHGLLELVAVFTPVFGAGRASEVVLWQRVARPDLLLPLLTRQVPAAFAAPGTWMHDALEVRDRWESRLLRVAPWSPLA